MSETQALSLPREWEEKAREIIKRLDGEFPTIQMGDDDIAAALKDPQAFLTEQDKSMLGAEGTERDQNGLALYNNAIITSVSLPQKAKIIEEIEKVAIDRAAETLPTPLIDTQSSPHGPYAVLKDSDNRYVMFEGSAKEPFKASYDDKTTFGRKLYMPMLDRALGKDYPRKGRLFGLFHEHMHVGDKILRGYRKNEAYSDMITLASECRADWGAASAYHHVTGDIGYIRDWARFRHIEMFLNSDSSYRHATQYVLQNWLKQKDPDLKLPPSIPSKEIGNALQDLDRVLCEVGPSLIDEKNLYTPYSKDRERLYRLNLLKIMPTALERGLIPEGYARDMAIGIAEAYTHFESKNLAFIQSKNLGPEHAASDIPHADYGQLKTDGATSAESQPTPNAMSKKEEKTETLKTSPTPVPTLGVP